MRFFADRREAGRELALRLRAYHDRAVVYALPRGGVETAVEVARALEAPLELLIARKIGHPMDPEYAICAVTETGPMVCNEAEQIAADPSWLRWAEDVERSEAQRRRESYLPGHTPVSVEGKVAIVVDDGIATGLTMSAAVADLRKQNPEELVAAVPCAPRDALDDLTELADEIVVLSNPDEYLGSVGAYYDLFPQLTDDDVLELLDEVA